MTLCPEAIPESLRRTPQWIVYRLKLNGKKTDKLPVDHRSGQVHDAHDAAIWMGFADALEVIEASKFDGIPSLGLGFVFTAADPFTGIDLDKCMNLDGQLEPWAEQIIDCFQSYSEFSVSGTGVHIIIRGKLPDGFGHKCNGQGAEGHGAFEVYDSRRFFTFTGDRLEGSRLEAENRQEEFEAFCLARLPKTEKRKGASEEDNSPPSTTGISDDDVIDFARKIWPGGTFSELFDDAKTSSYEGDPSRADMALCNFLSFWSGGNSDQIDRLFRRSALMRDKWDTKRGSSTYGAYTIDKVVKTASGFYHAAVETEENEGEGDGEESQSPSSSTSPPAWESPLLDDSAPADPFPLYVFPPDLARFLELGASCLTCPVDFLAMTALVTAGTAIGRSFVVKVKETWVETTSIYAALVARPGATKSPALAMVSRPLWAITESLLNEYKREVEYADKDDPKPKLRRIAVNDTTCEALAPILADNPRGVSLVRDELTAWVSGMNQYKTGGKGADRQFFLSAWAGASVTVDRKGQHETGPLHIPHPFLSVVGALTPDMISELSEEKTRDDGFIDRLLFTMPDPVQVRWNEEVIPDELSGAWNSAIKKLFAHPMIQEAAGKPRPFFVRFSPEARTLYSSWFNGHCAEAEADDFPRHLEGFWSKMRAYCARIALILDRLTRAYNPLDDDEENISSDVSAASVHAAIILTSYLKSHRRKVHGLIGTDNPDARAVLKWIRKCSKPVFSARDAKQNFRKRFAHDPEALADCLRWLETRACIRLIETPSKGPRPGRTKSDAYEVNPALLEEAFAEF